MPDPTQAERMADLWSNPRWAQLRKQMRARMRDCGDVLVVWRDGVPTLVTGGVVDPRTGELLSIDLPTDPSA